MLLNVYDGLMSKTTLITLILLAIFTPLFFLPITPNLVATPKEALLYLIGMSLGLTAAFNLVKNQTVLLPKTSSLVPILLLLVSIAATLAFNPEGRPESLASKGGTMLVIIALLPFILTTSKSLFTSRLNIALKVVGSALSLHSLLSLTFLTKLSFVPDYMQQLTFTPTGSYLTTLVIILASLTSLLLAPHIKKTTITYLLIGIHTVALVTIISLMLPGGSLSPRLLPITASWSIALDALKSLRSLFFGIGLSNYSLLYASVKPLYLNATDLWWNTAPTTATSELLTLLPTGGILLTMALIYLLSLAIFSARKNLLILPPLLILTLSLLIIPATLTHYLLLFFFAGAALISDCEETKPPKLLRIIMGIITLGFFSTLAFFGLRIFIGEYYLARAQAALSTNNSQAVYEAHLEALKYGPRHTNYHLSFAEVNFSLASALSQKEDLTDSDRSTIAQLIQQSIDAGKTAITLRPNDSRTWLTVGRIYQNLINVAEGSENFAVESYARALTLDRANPTLRVEYASLLSQLADKQTQATASAQLRNRAISELQTAIQLKSNFANAYYNLALVFRANKNQEAASLAYDETLKYLDPSGTDYQRVSTEKANLTPPTPLPSASIAPDSELSAPSPLPSPLEGGPIDLSNQNNNN